jgi:hypothetical protein
VHDFFRPSKSPVTRVVHDHYRALWRILRPLDPDGGSFRDTSGRVTAECEFFAPTPRLAVILTFGQSDIANECDPLDPRTGHLQFSTWSTADATWRKIRS